MNLTSTYQQLKEQQLPSLVLISPVSRCVSAARDKFIYLKKPATFVAGFFISSFSLFRQRMELAVSILSVLVGSMDVAGSGVERFVTKENLDSSRVSALLGKVGSEAVAQ